MFVWEASYTPGELNNKLMSVISAQRLTLLAAQCARPKQDGSALARLPSQMKTVTV